MLIDKRPRRYYNFLIISCYAFRQTETLKTDYDNDKKKGENNMTLKEFYEKVANDSELQAKVAEAAKSGKPLEEVLKGLGIDATVDELKAFVSANAAEGKLDKAQLDEVAGGTTPTVSTVVPAAGVTISISSLATC
jgi:predicted ribosomally synthesized peptide with nif11-like leader